MADQPNPNQEQRSSVQVDADPEEKADLERVVMAGTQALYDDKTHQAVLDMLKKGAQTPADTMAQVVVTIITQVDEQSGNQIPLVVILPAARELLAEVAQLAAHSGAFDGDAVAGEAMQKTVLLLGQQYEVNPEEVAAILEEMDPNEVQGMVDEQSQFAGAAGGGGQPQQAAAPPGAPPAGGGPMV